MGRESCSMCDIIGGDIYCAYRDYMCFLCRDMDRCPDGLDDEDDGYDDDEDPYFYDDLEEDESRW